MACSKQEKRVGGNLSHSLLEGTEVKLGNSSLMEARFGESEETNLKIMSPVWMRGPHFDGVGPVTWGCLGQLGKYDDLNSCNLFSPLGHKVQETVP